jgi:Protein of unknown function (DUF3828)
MNDPFKAGRNRLRMKYTGPDCLTKNPMESACRNRKGEVSALLFLLLFCINSCAQDRPSAKEFLSSLYRAYESSKDVNFLGEAADRFFTPGLLDLIRKDANQANGEVGRLNYDPICDCQDYEISNVRIKVKESEKNKAEADVHFTNSGTEVKVGFSLSNEGKGWRIADIRSKSVTSLYQLLQPRLAPSGK